MASGTTVADQLKAMIDGNARVIESRTIWLVVWNGVLTAAVIVLAGILLIGSPNDTGTADGDGSPISAAPPNNTGTGDGKILAASLDWSEPVESITASSVHVEQLTTSNLDAEVAAASTVIAENVAVRHSEASATMVIMPDSLRILGPGEGEGQIQVSLTGGPTGGGMVLRGGDEMTSLIPGALAIYTKGEIGGTLATGDHGGGVLELQGPSGQAVFRVGGIDAGGFLAILNRTGEEVVQILADEHGNGSVGAFNKQGMGRTLTPE